MKFTLAGETRLTPRRKARKLCRGNRLTRGDMTRLHAPSLSDPIAPREIASKDFAASGIAGGSLAKGSTYQRQRRATLLSQEVNDATITLTGRVRGTRAKPYSQTVSIARTALGGIEIRGTCTCPMEFQCKHVAAVVLQWCSDAPDRKAPAPTRLALVASAPDAPAPAAPPLAPALSKWLDDVAQIAARSDEAAAGVKKRLCYVLDRWEDGSAGVTVLAFDLNSQGRASQAPRPYDLQAALGTNPPKFLRVSDLSLLRRLAQTGIGQTIGGARRFRLSGAEGASILAEIISTGRAHWQDPDGPVLRNGEARTGEACWSAGEDGAQSIGFRGISGEALVTLALNPPHCVDPVTGQVGVLTARLPATMIAALLAAPPVPPEAAPDVGAALDRILAPDTVPKLARMPQPTQLRPALRPIARLTMKPMPRFHYQASSSPMWRSMDPPKAGARGGIGLWLCAGALSPRRFQAAQDAL